MGIEIDFLAVGDGERSGDAIALRYGNLHGSRDEQTVVVIDGGTKDSGDKLVELVKNRYRTDSVDFVFCTHPDGDHASGLTQVISSLTVGTLIMHQPWNHASEICDLFKDGRITDESLERRMRDALQAAHDLEVLAVKNNIKIVEPFAGVGYTDGSGSLVVVGPTEPYYESLLPHYRTTPEPLASLFRKAVTAVQEAMKWVRETIDEERLEEPGEMNGTSAENNSGAIIVFTVDGRNYLFTGDAGVPALIEAATYAGSQGINLSNVSFLQVPHHGSKRNVGPAILDFLRPEVAYISAAPQGDPKHPSRRVVNALVRRESRVCQTCGQSIWHYKDAPSRGDYHTIEGLPFFTEVEE